MWPKCRRAPRTAIALVCGCAIVNLCVLQHAIFRGCREREQSVAEQLVARYEPLDAWAPKGEAMQFVLDDRHVDREFAHPDARLYLAQYALSPRCVGRNVKSRWVIVDSDASAIVPKIAVDGRWTLVADFRNGLRLYRTDVRM
jgi:hypothetical protein